MAGPLVEFTGPSSLPASHSRETATELRSFKSLLPDNGIFDSEPIFGTKYLSYIYYLQMRLSFT